MRSNRKTEVILIYTIIVKTYKKLKDLDIFGSFDKTFRYLILFFIQFLISDLTIGLVIGKAKSKAREITFSFSGYLL